MKKLLRRFRDNDEPATKVFPLGLEVYSNPDVANVDILFVHGLTGGREKTWTDSTANQPWFRTLLPTSCPTARILAFGYDAYVTDYSSVVSQNKIENHAKNLLSAVGQHRDSDGTNMRSLILVAHSLGGLVCIDALLASKNSADVHLKSMIETTIAIAFLGTPHSGAALAKWGELLAKSIGMLKQTNSDIVKVLKTDSEVLARIQSEFHTMIRDRAQRGVRKISITCFFEELPLPGIGTIVPKNSAILPQYISIGIHANHLGMTKFSDVRDPGYKSVVGEIQRWIRDDLIVPLPSLKSEVAVSNHIQWSSLRKALSPSDVATQHSNRRRAHLAGTAEWLLETKSYQLWRSDHASSSLLWVNGPPGCGKSILAFNISQDLQDVNLENGNRSIFTSYCTHDANLGLQSYSILRTLAYQMAISYEIFAARLHQTLQHYGILEADKPIYNFISCEAFWEIFQGALTSITTKSVPVFWIIDGLDEVEIEDRALLMDIASDFIKVLPHCRVVILSRDESDIRKKLLLLRPLEVRMTEDSNKEDIRKYIKHRIRLWGALGSTNVENDVTDSLETRSQGIFLWVKLVMDELERIHDIGKVEEALASLPSDMKELYNTIFRNLVSRLDGDERHIFRCIISWMLFAKTALTLDQMAVALRPYGSFSADSLRISMPRIFGSIVLLENPEQQSGGTTVTSVHLLHASLVDYLKGNLDEGCKYSFDHGEAHGEIFSSCLAQLGDITQCPLFYPVGSADSYLLSMYKFGKLVGIWGNDGPEIIDPDSAGDESSTSYLSGEFVAKQYLLLKYAKKEWAHHLVYTASNPMAGEAAAKKLVNVLLRGPTILIWSHLLRRKDSTREQCVLQLLKFCDLMKDSEYLGIEIILDFTAQFASGSSASGWVYSLGKMANQAPEISGIDCDLGSDQASCTQLSQKRRSLRCGVLANASGQHLVALQAYADSCDIHLSERAKLENLDQWTPNIRQANFKVLACHMVSGKDPWLLAVFVHALSALGNAIWLIDFVSCMKERIDSSDPLILESQAQLFFSMGDFAAATSSYSALSAIQPHRWDLKEILISLYCLQCQFENALSIFPTFGNNCSIHKSRCEEAYNEQRRIKLCISSGRLQQAVTLGEEATKMYSEWWTIWDDLTECLLQLGEATSAIKCLRAARYQPRVALRASEKMIKILVDHEDYDMAYAEAISTIRQFPKHWEAYKYLRYCWKVSPDSVKPQIFIAFKQLTKESDPYWVASAHYARIQMDLKLFPAAIETCLNSKSAGGAEIFNYTAAKAFEALGRSEEALNLLLAVPVTEYRFTYNMLSFIARLSRQLLRWADLQRALQQMKSTGDEWTLNNTEALAWAHYKVQDYVQCKEECEEALAGITDSSSNSQLSQHEGLPPAWESSPENDSVNTLHVILSFAYVRLGEVTLAIQHVLLATASCPDLWYLAGTELRKMKRLALASFCLDAALQELQPDPENSSNHERLTREHVTCDICKTPGFEGVGYICIQCDDFNLCGKCFIELGTIHSESHSWLMCPSAGYPRLRIRGSGKERAREIVDLVSLSSDIFEPKAGEVYNIDPWKSRGGSD